MAEDVGKNDGRRPSAGARLTSFLANEVVTLIVMIVPAAAMFFAFCAYFEFEPFGLMLSKQSTVYFVGIPALVIGVFKVIDEGFGMVSIDNTQLMVAMVLFIFAIPAFFMGED